MKSIFQLIIILLTAQLSLSQATFPYEIEITPMFMEDLPGLHSFAHAHHLGKEIIIGGRRDGIHPRQPFRSFPESQNNDSIYILDLQKLSFRSLSLDMLPTNLQEQLQSSNMQFYQLAHRMILIGGYGYSSEVEDHVTHPQLVIVDLDILLKDSNQVHATAEAFYQLTDEEFAVTGGNLGRIEDTLYLVGGHRFDGRYNPMDHPTFVQEYTNSIKRFILHEQSGVYSVQHLPAWNDPAHLHRRDYNLVPQIFPDSSFGYTLFSGVFQTTEDLPFLYPVDINRDGYKPISAFNQYLNHYHSAYAAIYDSEMNVMHNLFLGGISQYHLEDGNLIQDDGVPFVKTISRVSRDHQGNLSEHPFSTTMPGFLGSSAALMINRELPQAEEGIIDFASIMEERIILGYFIGGINSEIPHAFNTNQDERTAASSTIFRIELVKIDPVANQQTILGNKHEFSVSVLPNPVQSDRVKMIAIAPVAGSLDITVYDESGRQYIHERVEGLLEGKNTIELNLSEVQTDLLFLSATLNGKFNACAKIVL